MDDFPRSRTVQDNSSVVLSTEDMKRKLLRAENHIQELIAVKAELSLQKNRNLHLEVENNELRGNASKSVVEGNEKYVHELSALKTERMRLEEENREKKEKIQEIVYKVEELKRTQDEDEKEKEQKFMEIETRLNETVRSKKEVLQEVEGTKKELENSRLELSDLREEHRLSLRRSREELNEKSHMIGDLRGKLQTSQEWSRDDDNIYKTITSVNEELKSSRVKYNDMEKKWRDGQNKLFWMKKQLLKCEDELNVERREKLKWRDIAESSRDSSSDLGNRLLVLQEECSRNSAMIEGVKLSEADHRHDLSVLKDSDRLLNEEREKVRRMCSDYDEEKKKMDQKLEEIEKEHQERFSNDVRVKIAWQQVEHEKQILMAENESLKNNNTSFELENRDQTEKLVSLEKEVAEYATRENKWKSELSIMKSENVALQEEVQEINRLVTENKEENREKEKSLSQEGHRMALSHSRAMKELENELVLKKKEFASMKNELLKGTRDHEQTKTDLENELSKSRSRVTRLEEERTRLENRVQELENATQLASSTIRSMELETSTVVTEMKSVIEVTQRQMLQKEEEVHGEQDKLHSKFSELTSENEDLKCRCRELKNIEEENQRLLTVKGKLEEQICEHQMRINDFELEVRQLKGEFESHESIWKVKSKTAEDNLCYLQEELKNSSLKVESLSNESRALQGKLSTTSASGKEGKELLEKCMNDLKRSEEDRRKAQKDAEEYHGKILSLMSQIKQKEVTLSDLNSQVNDMDVSMNRERKIRMEQENIIKLKEEETSRCKNEFETLLQFSENLENQLRETREEKGVISRENEEIISSLRKSLISIPSDVCKSIVINVSLDDEDREVASQVCRWIHRLTLAYQAQSNELDLQTTNHEELLRAVGKIKYVLEDSVSSDVSNVMNGKGTVAEQILDLVQWAVKDRKQQQENLVKLRQSRDELLVVNEKLNSDMGSFQRKKLILEEELQDLRMELEVVRKERFGSEENVRKIQEKNSSMNREASREIKKMHDEYSTVVEEKAEISAALNNEILALKHQLSDNEEQRKMIESKLLILKDEKNDMSEKLYQARKDGEVAHGRSLDLSELVDDLRDKNYRLEERLEQSRRDEQELQRSRRKCTSTSTTLDETKRELSLHRTQMRKMRLELDKAEERMKEERLNSSRVAAGLTARLNDALLTMQEIEEKEKNERKAHDSCLNQIQQLERHNDKMEKALRDQVRTVREGKTKLVTSLRKQIKELQNEVKGIETQNRKLVEVLSMSPVQPKSRLTLEHLGDETTRIENETVQLRGDRSYRSYRE